MRRRRAVSIGSGGIGGPSLTDLSSPIGGSGCSGFTRRAAGHALKEPTWVRIPLGPARITRRSKAVPACRGVGLGHPSHMDPATHSTPELARIATDEHEVDERLIGLWHNVRHSSAGRMTTPRRLVAWITWPPTSTPWTPDSITAAWRMTGHGSSSREVCSRPGTRHRLLAAHRGPFRRSREPSAIGTKETSRQS